MIVLSKRNAIRRLAEQIGRTQKRMNTIGKQRENAWKLYNSRLDALHTKKVNGEVSIGLMKLQLQELRQSSFKGRGRK